MKLDQRERSVGGQGGGYLLVEYMVYIVILVIIMGVAFGAFYRCLDNSRDLARNSEDILRVLRVGELWRADIRQAIASPEIVAEAGITACEIPTAQGRVVYIFGDSAVWRKDPDHAARQVLPRVKVSTMMQDRRQKITAWRWEIELQTRRKVVRMRPLFSFVAVPLKQP